MNNYLIFIIIFCLIHTMLKKTHGKQFYQIDTVFNFFGNIFSLFYLRVYKIK